MAARVVRKGLTVHYKGKAYPSGSTVDFGEDEAGLTAHRMRLEAEGYTAPEPAEGKDDHGSTSGDAFQHASGDTQSTDAKREINEAVRNPEKADYDARMTNLSQRLAEQAHGVKPSGEFPKEKPLPSVDLLKEEKGAPLLTNSPDDAPTEEAPPDYRRAKRGTKKFWEGDKG